MVWLSVLYFTIMIQLSLTFLVSLLYVSALYLFIYHLADIHVY